MKKYKIGTFTQGNSNEYSIYENTNIELKKRISNFKLENPKILLGDDEWDIGELDSGEYKCTHKRDVKWLSKETVESYLKSYTEAQRNFKYPAYKYFKECFGVISKAVYHEEILRSLVILDLIDIMDTFRRGDQIDTTEVHFYSTFYTYEILTHYKVSLKCGSWAQSMNLYFNENGDFVNRNYNQNLDHFENEIVCPSKILEVLKTLIKQRVIGNVIKSGNKFYTDQFCIIPFSVSGNDSEFGAYFIPARDDKSYQLQIGYQIHKKPTKSTQSSVDELIDSILDHMDDQQKLLCSISFLDTNLK